MRGEVANGICYCLSTDDNADVVLLTEALQLRSSELCNTYENGEFHKTSSTLVFNTASRIVQHYLAISGESWSTRSFYCPLTEEYDVTTNNCNYWAEMFAPLYESAISLPTVYPSQFPNHEQKMQQQQQQRKKRHRSNLKITLAYRGQDFCGWEDQRHSILNGEGGNSTRYQLPSVQGTLIDILDPILGYEKLHRGNETTITIRRPIKIKVAGRTDAGVSAIGQICRVRTWSQPTLEVGQGIEQFVKDHVNDRVAASMGNDGHGMASLPPLRVTNVECVDDTFHPTFSASCRAYAYLIDVDVLDDKKDDVEAAEERRDDTIRIVRHSKISSKILLQRLNSLLRALEGKELNYIALSYGKVKSETTLCTLYHARAHLVEWAASDDCGGAYESHQRAICIELVGDRFLRRMVRILVATAMREAIKGDVAHGSEEKDDDVSHPVDDALLNIVLSQDREQRTTAAPPDGLIFISAGYRINR